MVPSQGGLVARAVFHRLKKRRSGKSEKRKIGRGVKILKTSIRNLWAVQAVQVVAMGMVGFAVARVLVSVWMDVGQGFEPIFVVLGPFGCFLALWVILFGLTAARWRYAARHRVRRGVVRRGCVVDGQRIEIIRRLSRTGNARAGKAVFGVYPGFYRTAGRASDLGVLEVGAGGFQKAIH
jgi:hypothetical protein